MDSLKEHTSSNIISGFKKLGIYPHNKEEILKSLPFKKAADDLEFVGEAFLAHLEKKRCDAVTPRNTNRKKKKTKYTNWVKHHRTRFIKPKRKLWK